MTAKFALRDASLLGATLLFWWIAAERSAGPGPVADFTGLLAGLLAGASAYVLHEWGHLLTAFALGSTVGVNANLRSPFAFRFDPDHNSLAQFVGMSLGGFFVTGVVVAVAYGLLPEGLLATRVARGAVLFLTFLTVVLELPLLVYGIVRGRVPTEAAVRIQGPSVPGRTETLLENS
jgi:hypothetical protein